MQTLYYGVANTGHDDEFSRSIVNVAVDIFRGEKRGKPGNLKKREKKQTIGLGAQSHEREMKKRKEKGRCW